MTLVTAATDSSTSTAKREGGVFAPRLIAAIVGLFAALSFSLAMTGCASSGNLAEGLPDWADEQTVTQTAHEVIDAYSSRDYDAVAQMCPALGLSADEYAANGDPLLDQLGAFVQYGDHAFLHGESDGTSFATVVQIAEYENGQAQYTVSVNQDGSVSGFYVKTA